MAKENDNVDIEIPEQEDLSGLDESTDWKAKAEEIDRRHREAGIRNRERSRGYKSQLAERDAKIAELSLQLSGKDNQQTQTKPDEVLLKKVSTALLRASGYSDPDELAVFDKWSKDTGKSSDELLDHPSLLKVIKAEIEDIRTGKANDAATKKIQGRGGGSDPARTDPNYWMNKGEAPPNTPEYKDMRAKMRQMLAEKETGLSSL